MRSNRPRRESGHDSTDANHRHPNSSSRSTRSHGTGFVSDRTGASASNTGRSSRSRLVPSSPRTNTSPIVSTPSHYKARSRPVLDASATSPAVTSRSHPIPDVPQRVISPPAHPDLFFADPILGQYVLPPSRPKPGKSRRLRGPPAPSDDGHSRSEHKRFGLTQKRQSSVPSPVESSPGVPSAPASLLPLARTKEVLGRVDALVKNAYELRGTPRTEAMDYFGEQPAGAGLPSTDRRNRSRKEGEELDSQL